MDKAQLDQNRDPFTGEPGAHVVGTGLGAAAGGIAAGAAIGTVAGPIGTAIGAAVGAVLGGLGGKAVAENFDPTIVDEHWRDRYEVEPYYADGMSYEDYAPFTSSVPSRGSNHPASALMSWRTISRHSTTKCAATRAWSGNTRGMLRVHRGRRSIARQEMLSKFVMPDFARYCPQ